MGDKGIGFYLNIGAIATKVIAVILYFVKYLPLAGSGDNVVIFLFSICVALEVALIFIKADWSEWLEILLAFLCALTPMRIITSNTVIMSFVDLVNSIDYFGNAALIPWVIAISVLCFMSVLFTVVGAFSSRWSETH